MGSASSTASAAGTAVKRAFPTAHRSAAKALEKKTGTRATLDVQREAPIHLRAAAAAARGETKLTNNTSEESKTTPQYTQTTGFDLESLSAVVEPGLGADGVRAETLASSNQASFVEELRDQYVAEMKTKSDPGVEMARMMGEIGPVHSENQLYENQKDKSKTVNVIQRTSILQGGFVELRELLYAAEDIAELDGDPYSLPLQHAVDVLAKKHDLDEDSVEQLLRLHAVPAFVNENVEVVSQRDDMNDGHSFAKKWRGYWPIRIDE